MGNWFKLNEKVAAALITLVVLVIAGPYLKAQGIDIGGSMQGALAILAAYMTPTGGGQ